MFFMVGTVVASLVLIGTVAAIKAGLYYEAYKIYQQELKDEENNEEEER
jgi:hypothetical protein